MEVKLEEEEGALDFTAPRKIENNGEQILDLSYKKYRGEFEIGPRPSSETPESPYSSSSVIMKGEAWSPLRASSPEQHSHCTQSQNIHNHQTTHDEINLQAQLSRRKNIFEEMSHIVTPPPDHDSTPKHSFLDAFSLTRAMMTQEQLFHQYAAQIKIPTDFSSMASATLASLTPPGNNLSSLPSSTVTSSVPSRDDDPIDPTTKSQSASYPPPPFPGHPANLFSMPIQPDVFLNQSSTEQYKEFRQKMVESFKRSKKGTNINMRRCTKSPNAPSSPSDDKDAAYWEKRRKNNEAAKRSRDSRRAKELEVTIRAEFLEQENIKLKYELFILKQEHSKLRFAFYGK